MEINFEAVLFDLDGTLLDTLADITDSANTALRQLDCPTHPLEDYKYFVGKGMGELARQILPPGKRDKKTVIKCLSLLKQYYTEFWQRNSKPYPGITKLLTELENRNIVKVVFSNKPDEFTGIMIRTLLPDWEFKIIRGALPDVPIKPDPTAALQIASQVGIIPEKFLYLGDSSTDMQTANAAGMYAVGVLWGFRQADELLENGAKILIKEPLEILKLLQ